MQIKPNPGIENLSAYLLADLSAPTGYKLISLAQNELHFKPSVAVVESAQRAAKNANQYPDPSWTELTRAIADVHEINCEQILCGAGSMELLELLGRIYLSSDNTIVMSEYGYSFFKTVAQMYSAQINIAGELNYKTNVDLLLQQIKPNTKIVFIANPGNPTGTLLAASEIRRLRNELPSHILLIVDEAYAEFTDTDEYPALFDLAEQGNTVVLRTFSKVYGLAGMRVGWGYFPKQIHTHVRKVLNPNNISAMSQACATTAILDQDEMRRRKDQVNRIKVNFCRQLNTMGYATTTSQSNFVLIDFNSESIANTVFSALRKKGVILRPMNAYGLSHCLRATISNQQDMDFTSNLLARINKEFLS